MCCSSKIDFWWKTSTSDFDSARQNLMLGEKCAACRQRSRLLLTTNHSSCNFVESCASELRRANSQTLLHHSSSTTHAPPWPLQLRLAREPCELAVGNHWSNPCREEAWLLQLPAAFNTRLAMDQESYSPAETYQGRPRLSPSSQKPVQDISLFQDTRMLSKSLLSRSALCATSGILATWLMWSQSTTRRSTLRITREAELLGGELHAYHSRENLVLRAKFLRQDLPYFTELLAEVITKTRYTS